MFRLASGLSEPLVPVVFASSTEVKQVDSCQPHDFSQDTIATFIKLLFIKKTAESDQYRRAIKITNKLQANNNR